MWVLEEEVLLEFLKQVVEEGVEEGGNGLREDRPGDSPFRRRTRKTP